MPRLEGNYNQLFIELERKYNIEDMNKETISKFLGTKTPRRESLAEQLSVSNVLFKDIRKARKESDLDKIDIISSTTHRSELQSSLESKRVVLTRKRLIKKGKTLSILTLDLKQAKTEEEIDDIVEQGRDELGEGRNLSSLIERANIRREDL